MAQNSPVMDTQFPGATASHALRSETLEYARLTAALYTIRRLFADGQTDAAREACEGLMYLTRDLQLRAQERAAHFTLKADSPEAESLDEEPRAAYDDALGELLRAQRTARAELVATVDILNDLRAHTAGLRRVLSGRGPGTYDRNGQTAMAGGSTL